MRRSPEEVTLSSTSILSPLAVCTLRPAPCVEFVCSAASAYPIERYFTNAFLGATHYKKLALFLTRFARFSTKYFGPRFTFSTLFTLR
jgi:hypothetical protein